MPEPRKQSSKKTIGENASSKTEEKIRQFANLIIDRVIEEHEKECGVPSFL